MIEKINNITVEQTEKLKMVPRYGFWRRILSGPLATNKAGP